MSPDEQTPSRLVDTENLTSKPIEKRRPLVILWDGSLFRSLLQFAVKIRTVILAVVGICAAIFSGVAAINAAFIVPKMREVATEVVNPIEKRLGALEREYVTKNDLHIALERESRVRAEQIDRLISIMERVENRQDEMYRLNMAHSKETKR